MKLVHTIAAATMMSSALDAAPRKHDALLGNDLAALSIPKELSLQQPKQDESLSSTELNNFLAADITAEMRSELFSAGKLNLSKEMSDSASIILKNDLVVNLESFSPEAQYILKAFTLAVFTTEKLFWSEDREAQLSSIPTALFAVEIAAYGPQDLIKDTSERSELRRTMANIFMPLREIMEPTNPSLEIGMAIQLNNTGYTSLNHSLNMSERIAVFESADTAKAVAELYSDHINSIYSLGAIFIVGAAIAGLVTRRRLKPNPENDSLN